MQSMHHGAVNSTIERTRDRGTEARREGPRRGGMPYAVTHTCARARNMHARARACRKHMQAMGSERNAGRPATLTYSCM